MQPAMWLRMQRVSCCSCVKRTLIWAHCQVRLQLMQRLVRWFKINTQLRIKQISNNNKLPLKTQLIQQLVKHQWRIQLRKRLIQIKRLPKLIWVRITTFRVIRCTSTVRLAQCWRHKRRTTRMSLTRLIMMQRMRHLHNLWLQLMALCKSTLWLMLRTPIKRQVWRLWISRFLLVICQSLHRLQMARPMPRLILVLRKVNFMYQVIHLSWLWLGMPRRRRLILMICALRVMKQMTKHTKWRTRQFHKRWTLTTRQMVWRRTNKPMCLVRLLTLRWLVIRIRTMHQLQWVVHQMLWFQVDLVTHSRSAKCTVKDQMQHHQLFRQQLTWVVRRHSIWLT